MSNFFVDVLKLNEENSQNGRPVLYNNGNVLVVSPKVTEDNDTGAVDITQAAMNRFSLMQDDAKTTQLLIVRFLDNFLKADFKEFKDKMLTDETIHSNGNKWSFKVKNKDGNYFICKGNIEFLVISMSKQELVDYFNENNLSNTHIEYNAEEDSMQGSNNNRQSTDKLIRNDKNVILYGPPGTGKTYNSVNYAVAIIDNEDINDVKERSYEDTIERFKELKEQGRIQFTTFHQSYGYEEFIEGIKPAIDGNKDSLEGIKPVNDDDKSTNIQYRYEDGIFKKFCNDARGNSKPYVFIIDEINRGNISKIFGELITLIEETKREGQLEEVSVTLSYTKKPFSVPNNVYILGTMNTADRSIALLDTALRRRFKFIEMMPDPQVLKAIPKIDGINVVKMLETMNERIEYLFDREHTIGHAYFTKLNKYSNIEDLASIFRNAIIPLLQEYFYDDYSRIQLVLGDNAKNGQFKFIQDESINIRQVFNGSVDDALLPEKKYSINYDAFNKAESYISIYEAQSSVQQVQEDVE